MVVGVWTEVCEFCVSCYLMKQISIAELSGQNFNGCGRGVTHISFSVVALMLSMYTD